MARRSSLARTSIATAAAAIVLATASTGAQFTMRMPAEQNALLATVVLEDAARGPVAPVPLMGDGSHMMGALFDQYRIGMLIARERLAAGQRPDADSIQSHPVWQARATVIVAYPVDCKGQPNRPNAIRPAGAIGPVAPTPVGEPVRGSAASALLPGVTLPGDALVVAFRNLTMSNTVTLHYDGPVCGGGAREMSFPLFATPPRELFTAFAGVKLPADLSSVPTPATVRLHGLVDARGRVRFAQQVQGPVELGPVAIATVSDRTFAAFSLNSQAMPIWTMVTLVYTETGDPAPAAAFVPPGLPPGALTTTQTTTVTVPAAPPPPPPGAVPPAPPGQTDTQLATLAIELARQGLPTPIPLDAAGPAVHGVLYDRFLVSTLRVHARLAAGESPDPSPAIMRNDQVIVAFPLECGNRTVRPTDMALASGGTTPGLVRRSGGPLEGASLDAALPGATLPAGAIGWTFVNALYSAGLEVRISYDGETCGGSSSTATLPLNWVRGTSLPRMSTVRMPESASAPSPTMVRLRGMVDLQGQYRFPTIADGPGELEPAAATHASQWRFQPYRVNGVAVPQGVLTSLTFTTSGMPEPAATPASVAPPMGGALPPIMTNSTVGGRSTTDFTTADVAGLSASTSRCAIAEDATYGFTAEGAIRMGGSFTEGPARSRRYLAALRGPSGQGLHVVRRGTTMAPDKETPLDVYEVTYPGLASPLVLYVNLYLEAPLQAPKGLTCATPIDGG